MADSNSSEFQVSRNMLIFLSIVFGIVVAVLVAILCFGPIIYTILLKQFLGQQFDFNYATQFLNNVISIAAIALSIIAIIATLIGLNWQFKQTESAAELKKDIGEIREELRGFRAPVTVIRASSTKLGYEDQPTTKKEK